MRFKQNDGGRKRGGWKGEHAGDCVPRAIAITTEQHYRDVRRDLDALVSEMTGGLDTSTNDGTPEPVSHKYLIDRGWTLALTKGQYLKDLPNKGTFIACLTRHSVAVINGVVHDSWDSRVSRRTKCGSPKMLGYYYISSP